MQTIFCLNITLLVPVFDRLVSSLSFSYQKKIYSYYNSKDRLRCLAGKLLVDHIGQGKTILYNEYNKPFFHDGPYFNLTHSGDFACLAVSENSLLGIDIEKQKYGDYLAVAKAVFHPAELNFFLFNPGMDVFFKIWTLKESYVKMLGIGFSINPQDFCMLPWECINHIKGFSLYLPSFT